MSDNAWKDIVDFVKPKTADASGMEEKKDRTWENAKPSDLVYVGVQERGLAMSAAKSVESRRKEMERALKED
jgi:hypothetical protein